MESRAQEEQQEQGTNRRHLEIKHIALSYVSSVFDSWESDCLPLLAKDGLLGVCLHEGFWEPMDTLRDKRSLEAIASKNQIPPWLNIKKN